MPSNTVTITFNSLPSVDDYISIKVKSKTPPFTIYTRTVTFKTLRSGFGQCTIMPTVNDQASSYASVLGLDYGVDFLVFTPDAGQVTLSIYPAGPYSEITEVRISGEFATTEMPPEADLVTISGLESNNYLINNDIWLTLTTTVSDVDVITLSLQNVSTGLSSGMYYLYPISESCRVNISPSLKAIFNEPENNHVNSFSQVEITYGVMTNDVQTANYTITKKFIRGGKRTNEINNTLPVGTLLSPSDKIAMWTGYVPKQYTLTAEGIAETKVSDENEYPRRVKGCNPFFFRFLNQLGGYSYWLFEGWDDTDSNTNMGSINRIGNTFDLGNDYKNDLQVFSKVPAAFIGLIQDLIISPDIYIYNTELMKWDRVSSDNNKVQREHNRKVYDVKLKFKTYNNLNPSVLW